MAKGWSVSGVSACIPQCSIPNSIYMIVLNVLQPHLPVQCDCSPSPSFPSPLLSFYPPFLPLPLPLSFLWIASLLILIAYALACLSYLLPPPFQPSLSYPFFAFLFFPLTYCS